MTNERIFAVRRRFGNATGVPRAVETSRITTFRKCVVLIRDKSLTVLQRGAEAAPLMPSKTTCTTSIEIEGKF